MLEQIRRGTQSGLSYILVGVLIVFFAVFFGVPADGCRSGDGGRVLMANVSGQNIHTEDVNTIQYRYFGGNNQGTRDDDFFNQQAQALKYVIITYLLADRAEEAGLRVSDDEFRGYINDPVRNSEFLRAYGPNGQFDGPYYERYVMHGLRVPLGSYEDFKRTELLARKYLVMLEMQVHVTPEEVQELHEARNTRVDLEYVQFTEDSLVDVIGLDDNELQAFIASDEGQDEIAEYFEEHRDQYEEPERVRLRTIQIFKPADESDDQEAQLAQQSYEDARQRVFEEGEDFATVATEHSAVISDGEGGLDDWRTLDEIDEALPEVLADAEIGDLREVETDFAYILVKLEDREQAVVPDIEDVQHEIAEILLRQDIVATRGTGLAEILHSRLNAGLSIDEALTELEEQARDEEREEDAEIWAGLSAQRTGHFTLARSHQYGRAWDDIPGLGQHRDLAIAAFDLTEDEPLIDEVIEINGARAVLRLNDREDPEELSESERAELMLEARSEKINELFGPWPLGPWPPLFDQPISDIGHFAESVFTEAMSTGDVRLYERNSRAAALVRQMSEGPENLEVEGLDG